MIWVVDLDTRFMPVIRSDMVYKPYPLIQTYPASGRIAHAYEDVNDHIRLRHDPALLAAVKNTTDENQPLGSASTLSRLENRITEKEISELNKLFVELFIESYDTPPTQIVIDVDATDDIIHGNQEGGYFNGFYDNYCFLPLYFFCGGQLLWSQLRTSNKGGGFGAVAIFAYIAKRLKKEWPDVEIVFRGDAGFYSSTLLWYCERHGHKYILGFSSNAVLKRMSANIVFASEMFFVENGSQEPFRLFREYLYQAGTWKVPRKIIVKAERLPDKTADCRRQTTAEARRLYRISCCRLQTAVCRLL